MIDLASAQQTVLSKCEALTTETVAIADSLGLVLAQQVHSNELIPPFDNTAVDGFALRAQDTIGASEKTPVTLKVVAQIAAGVYKDIELKAGEAVSIMTGAPIPDGADAVVMVEDTNVEWSALKTVAESHKTVSIFKAATAGDAIRKAGEDIKAGQLVFEPKTQITPGHIGVLATLGFEQIKVTKAPKVAVFSTGDELTEDRGPLKPGQIRDSNRHSLIAMVKASGYEAVDFGLIADDRKAIEDTLRKAAQSCDAVITSGGVSMGEFDLVKAVLAEIADMTWMQVAIKPAKPLAVGTIEGTPIFGLPGNPVSCMVSYELFARPALRKMAGHSKDDLYRRTITTSSNTQISRRADGKTHFYRTLLQTSENGLKADLAAAQGSHQLLAMARAEGLAVIPDGQGLKAGECFEVIPLKEL